MKSMTLSHATWSLVLPTVGSWGIGHHAAQTVAEVTRSDLHCVAAPMECWELIHCALHSPLSGVVHATSKLVLQPITSPVSGCLVLTRANMQNRKSTTLGPDFYNVWMSWATTLPSPNAPILLLLLSKHAIRSLVKDTRGLLVPGKAAQHNATGEEQRQG